MIPKSYPYKIYLSYCDPGHTSNLSTLMKYEFGKNKEPLKVIVLQNWNVLILFNLFPMLPFESWELLSIKITGIVVREAFNKKIFFVPFGTSTLTFLVVYYSLEQLLRPLRCACSILFLEWFLVVLQNNIFPSKSKFSFSHPINLKQFVWNWWGQVLGSKFC